MGIKEDAYKMLSIALPRVSDQSRPPASFTVIYYSSDLLLLFPVNIRPYYSSPCAEIICNLKYVLMNLLMT